MIDLLQREQLLKDHLVFTKTFYYLKNGREFATPYVIGRESHYLTVSRELENMFHGKLVDEDGNQTYRLIINIPPGYGKPVSEETLILKDDASRIKLKDLKIGDNVLTHRGRFRRVNKIFNQGLLPTLKIKTFSGREVITAYDHPFLTAKGWKEAQHLKIDDMLAIAIPQEDFGNEILDEEARLLGYFIGDGCLTSGASNITACDLIEIEDIKHCCAKLGFTCTAKQYALKNRKSHHSQTLHRLNISGGIRDWLKSHGINNKNSYTKTIPAVILSANKRGISQFIGAYFACDGTLGGKGSDRKDQICSFTSVSRKLLEETQHLFVRLGIRSRIRTKILKKWTAKQGDTYTSYNLELGSQNDLYKFQQLIPIYHSKGNSIQALDIVMQRFDHPGIISDPIIEITENIPTACMCIEVEEDHTFTANDIVVHNSTLLVYFVAWAMANYPDSQIMYISYSAELAEKHTATIKEIMEMPAYRALFGIEISKDTKAKGDFATTAGGRIKAYGTNGSITGMDAGFPGVERFSGLVIIDDAHKPNEVHSDTRRNTVIDTAYMQTIYPRPRSDIVPICFIGQCLHQSDLAAFLKNGRDGFKWRKVVLKGLDDAGNALAPHLKSKETLLLMREYNTYTFASQVQQDPIPAGGALFKEEWFITLDEEPDIIATFITADTAETNKTYNDASAFSFWGIYKIKFGDIETAEYGLHLLDCREKWIEPVDLESEFYDFYTACMRYPVKPLYAAIEKKSTGTTLASVLSKVPGIKVMAMDRSIADGSKSDRFIEIQPYLGRKQVTLPRFAKHVKLFVDHMTSITANDTHDRDDICFVAGTKIATLFGFKNIENITSNDLVITPFGLGRIESHGCTGHYPTIQSLNLKGTPAHPIFSGNKFERLDTLKDDSKIDKISFSGLLKWKYLKLLISMGSPIGSWGRENIILANTQREKIKSAHKDCMWRFMNFIAERKFQKGLLFITKTMIVLITTFLIWNVFRASNILRCTLKSVVSVLIRLKNWPIWQRLESKLQNGIKVLPDVRGIESMQKQASQKEGLRETSNVLVVEKILRPNSSMLNIATQIVEPELIAATSVSAVYNLKVKEYGVYYANEILVSNCDTVVDAIRAALIDRIVLPNDSRASETSKMLAQAESQRIRSMINKRSSW